MTRTPFYNTLFYCHKWRYKVVENVSFTVLQVESNIEEVALFIHLVMASSLH